MRAPPPDGGGAVSRGALPGWRSLLTSIITNGFLIGTVVTVDGGAELDRLRLARAQARARAWRAGAGPEEVILDFDATP